LPGQTHTRSEAATPLSLEELEQILIYFSTSLYGQNSEEDILWDLARNCISRLGFVDCVIYLLDEERNVLIQTAALGPKNPKRYEILNPIEIKIGQGITGHVALTGIPERIDDTTRDPRYIVDDEARQSELCVPIIAEGKVIGLIDSEHPQKGFFTAQHLRILTAIASICSNKLLKVRAEKDREEARQLMNDLKARALRAQLSPHFVFNALNAIQHFITSDQKEKSIRFLSLFSKLIRYHLSNYEKDEALLEKDLEMLEWYLRLQQLRYEDRFSYRFERHLGPDSAHIVIPSLVLSSLMEFAVEQSMFHQAGLSKLFLTVTRQTDTVDLEVIYGPVHLEKDAASKAVNYREEFLPWDEQSHLLNRIKGYTIETGTEILPGEEPGSNRIRIQLSLPILSMPRTP
jgi:putative methionine-R-sulfoxide reductase with GAF domain